LIDGGVLLAVAAAAAVPAVVARIRHRPPRTRSVGQIRLVLPRPELLELLRRRASPLVAGDGVTAPSASSRAVN
jgi:hypothetical protein